MSANCPKCGSPAYIEGNTMCFKCREASELAQARGSASRPPKDRKDSIEMVLVQAKKLCGNEHEMAQAWLRLCRDLEAMTEPEARMPRFTKLLHVLWIAATNDHT